MLVLKWGKKDYELHQRTDNTVAFLHVRLFLETYESGTHGHTPLVLLISTTHVGVSLK